MYQTWPLCKDSPPGYLPSHPLLNEALQDVLVGREQRPTEAASAEHLDLA